MTSSIPASTITEEQPTWLQNTLTVLITTRHRYGSLTACVNSAIARAGRPINIIIGFDDDPEGYEACPSWPGTGKVLLRPRHYYTRAVNRLFWAAQQTFKDFDHFCLFNDDVLFVKDNWAIEAMLRLHAAFPEGMGVLELYEERLCSHYISRAKVFNAHHNGLLADMRYTHYFSDSDLRHHLDELGLFQSIGGGILDERLIVHQYTQDSLRNANLVWRPFDMHLFKAQCKKHDWDDFLPYDTSLINQVPIEDTASTTIAVEEEEMLPNA